MSRRYLKALLKSCKNAEPGSSKADIIKEKRQALRKKLRKWRPKQLFYMPMVEDLNASFLESKGPINEADVALEKTRLWLPSEIAADRHKLRQQFNLVERECMLRFAQAMVALQSPKNLLNALSAAFGYKKRHITGQGQQTRAQNSLALTSDRVARAAQNYRSARGVLVSLAPNGRRMEVLKPLLQDDIVSCDALDIAAVEKEPRAKRARKASKNDSEGRRKHSWIWNAQRALTEEDVNPPQQHAGAASGTKRTAVFLISAVVPAPVYSIILLRYLA